MTAAQPLTAVPRFSLRTEVVDCPELGGALTVRGLMASEAFAVEALRSQALRRVVDARREHLERDRARRAQLAAAGQDPAAMPEAEFEAPALQFDELRGYGRYVAELLAVTVTLANGLQAYTADEWEVVGQHHPTLLPRLQAVAERLSGLNAEDVRKNSAPSPA